ncbi:hypothetical protein EQU24_16520 [Methylotuvimicrobium buryatense]|uniref:DUF4935 domain-containing protein n=1 Tax=Methylotuvimicrobium buryatense TaxID=95641 RepID=A0A4P9UQP0_METBY|nr:PIN domain-containing protein [Methylotuvimicrobium buryatense]QCW83667.1 hypothetical protein EQU24_16520 [Methylotuvimicrobium buryatense]
MLDTNIYRSNPSRNNLNFQAIEKLANAGWLKLHIPYVVEREFQTQQREIYSKDLEKAQSGLSCLSRKQLSPEVLEIINLLKAQLEAESENILLDAEKQLADWAESIDANRYPLCLDQAHTALEAYFHGFPPFKAPKIRDDIPDSFVVQAINKLCLENGDIHLVAGDKKVRDAFSERKSVTVYKDLSDFIESEIIQNELKDIDLLGNIEEIKLALQAYEDECSDISTRISSDVGEAIVGRKISDPSIPDDNNEATIYGYDSADEIEFDFTELAYYGNGQFGFPFSLKTMVSAIYYIYKADYYCMDDGPSVTDHNDHYFEAEDEFEVIVTGAVSITIDRDKINMDEFSECIDQESIAIDEVQSIDLSK